MMGEPKVWRHPDGVDRPYPFQAGTAAVAYGGQAERKGDWLETYTGVRFYPLDPRQEEVNVVDISHALSMQCRYGGHCRRFYSVAQHSCHLADFAFDMGGAAAARIMLFHDASEAYLPDIVRPVKYSIPGLKDAERNLEAVVLMAVGLPPVIPAWAKQLDRRILIDERLHLMSPSGHKWSDVEGLDPLGLESIPEWNPERACYEWQKRFLLYGRQSRR